MRLELIGTKTRSAGGVDLHRAVDAERVRDSSHLGLAAVLAGGLEGVAVEVEPELASAAAGGGTGCGWATCGCA